MFIDKVKIYVKSGSGGNGCVSFRREKYVPFGGPDGGNGGKGGDVIIRADRRLKTLLDLKYHPHYCAERGRHGQGKKKQGKKGEDLIIMGATVPESEIAVHIGSSQEIVKKITAKTDGDWQHNFDTLILEEGANTVRAKTQEPGGLLSIFSNVLNFYIGKYGSVEVCPRADFNKDGKTDLIDFSIMLYWWGKYNPCVDQNQDGIVNLPDFSILMYWWTG